MKPTGRISRPTPNPVAAHPSTSSAAPTGNPVELSTPQHTSERRTSGFEVAPLPPYVVPRKPELSVLSASPSQQVSARLPTYSKSKFYELRPQQERALAAKMQEIRALETHNEGFCHAVERDIQAVLSAVLPDTLDPEWVADVARAAQLSPSGWAESSAQAVADLQAARKLLHKRAQRRIEIDPRVRRQYQAARQELATAQTAFGSAQRAVQAAEAERQKWWNILAGEPAAEAAARAEVSAAEQVSTQPREAAKQHVQHTRESLDAFDGPRINALRSRRWRQSDYRSTPLLSPQWWRDSSAARQAKKNSGYNSYRTMLAVYEHAEAAHQSAVERLQNATRTARARENLAHLLAAQPVNQHRYEIATAEECREKGRLPLQEERLKRAEIALAPIAETFEQQSREVAAYEQALTQYNQCKQQGASLVAKFRKELRARTENPLETFGKGLRKNPVLGRYLVRLNMLTHKLQYLREAQRDFLPAAMSSVQHSQRELAVRTSECNRSKRTTMTYKGLLWRLDHWEWEKRDANLTRFRKIAADVFYAQPDEKWALAHATDRWTWWTVFTHGKHDAKYQPAHVARLNEDPSYRPITASRAPKQVSRAGAAMLQSGRGGSYARSGGSYTRGYTSSDNDAFLWAAMADMGGNNDGYQSDGDRSNGSHGSYGSNGDNPDTRS